MKGDEPIEGLEGRISRRSLLASGVTAAGAVTFGPGLVRRALAAPARAGEGPYGTLRPPDGNGIQLPPEFTSRRIARSGLPVPGTSYVMPIFPDGQATFPTRDGGWILVTNSESLAIAGAGASAIRFDQRGAITGAYRILGGTNVNCAGGPTPWGTWLSGEEIDGGMIWECDPAGVLDGQPRPLLGVFKHEAAAVDPVEGRVYLTEDHASGCFYRFTPSSYPSLDAGMLESARVAANGTVTWRQVPDPTTAETGAPTRNQVYGATRFKGGEGIWYGRGVCYFTTKGDCRVWTYDIGQRRMEVLYDREQSPDAALDAVDNVTVTAAGDVFVCEDGGNMEIGLISAERTVSPFLRLPDDNPQSEICGVCFDPSGGRMYFTSQRAGDSLSQGPGAIYEVSGPFRLPAGGQPPDFVPGPPAGEERPDGPLNPIPDRAGPKLRLQTRRRIRGKRLRRQGLPVRVSSNEPARLALSLRSSDFGRTPGKGGSTPRPKDVKLAGLRLGAIRLERGGEVARLRLPLPRRSRRRLARRLRRRSRPVSARLIAVAVDGAGNRSSQVAQVTIRRS